MLKKSFHKNRYVGTTNFIWFMTSTLFRFEIFVQLKIENTNCSMQLDTGCALSLAPISFIKEVCPDVKINPTNVIMSTYTGETVRPLGEACVNVEYSGSQYSLPLLIVNEGSCALFRQNWLMHIKLDWQNLPGLNNVETLPSDLFTIPATSGDQTLDYVLEQYSELFQPELGC